MNIKKINLILVLLVSIAFLSAAVGRAEGSKKDGGKNLRKTAQVSYTYLDVNNISTYFYNNGDSDLGPNSNSGFVYPKGSGKTAVFEAGLIWGAKVVDSPSQDPYVEGSTYGSSLQPGNVSNGGVAGDPKADKFSVYRVVAPGTNLTDIAKNENISESALQAALDHDAANWPADLGAPFDDKNNNGTYDPGTDVPGVPGADMTLWFVANDLNNTLVNSFYGGLTLGMEMQATIWAYNRAGALGNMYFRKYKLINVTGRGGDTPPATTFYQMYVSMWADVDLGNAGDDFVGVDTVLSLQYCYNAGAVDATYAPLPPPAVGFDFFQGPLLNGVAGQDRNKNGVDDAVDYGIFDGKKVGPGKINLPMTAAYYFANGNPVIGDPNLGKDIQASREFYNFMQGKYGLSGSYFTDPNTGKQTTYALSGDPQKGTGWLDGVELPAGDRRQGSASGPFTMAPGDTQEVVVAEIVGGAIPGSDRLSAIGILKFYDQQAQLAYDNFFDLPTAPPAPNLIANGLDQEIVLDWGSDAAAVQATETSSTKGYTFQGYNVYQLPSASSTVETAKRVATYDRIDGVGKIEDKFFDSNTGVVAVGVRQFGNDTGIKRYVHITQDYIKGGTPIINGLKYYFAVTAYNYNPDQNAVPNNLENPISIITIVPHKNDPGVTQATTGDKTVVHTGTADASADMKVIDPSKLTGHNYKVDFYQTDYFRDTDGKWKIKTSKPSGGSKFSPNDVSPSSVSIIAQYGKVAGNLDLVATVDVQAPDYAYSAGVSLKFPAGVKINSAETYDGCANGETLPGVIAGDSVTWGGDTHSGFGCFGGGDQLHVNVTSTLPLSVDYLIYDDDYSAVYGSGSQYKNATGTTTVTTASFALETQDQWKLTDVTSGTTLLEHQTVFGGVDLYYGLGGSSNPLLAVGPIGVPGTLAGHIGADAAPTIDGFQLNVSGSFDAPINFASVSLGSSSNSTLSSNSTTTNLDIQNYTIFSGVVSSKAIDNFGVGTNDIDELQQDYELRFTGVRDSTTVGTQTVYTTKDGTGSLATVFGTSAGPGNGLGSLPLNPSPGTNAPFLQRVPFEVWNVDKNIQVNMMYRERTQAGTENPYYVWNYSNREYAVLVNTPYDSTTPQPYSTTAQTPALATWVLVFYGTNYNTGDTVSVKYANPIQPGKDNFTFSTQKLNYNSSLAKTDVNQINVFPNPYYGVNSQELNKYNRFVTFSHLPANATIRIFNLAGIMVRTIAKTGGDQFQRWDLQNENGLPVASGLYIAYIDMPDLGTTKILKFAIIQEQQILDRF
jgi:hypothetical protein